MFLVKIQCDLRKAFMKSMHYIKIKRIVSVGIVLSPSRGEVHRRPAGPTNELLHCIRNYIHLTFSSLRRVQLSSQSILHFIHFLYFTLATAIILMMFNLIRIRNCLIITRLSQYFTRLILLMLISGLIATFI